MSDKANEYENEFADLPAIFHSNIYRAAPKEWKIKSLSSQIYVIERFSQLLIFFFKVSFEINAAILKYCFL